MRVSIKKIKKGFILSATGQKTMTFKKDLELYTYLVSIIPTPTANNIMTSLDKFGSFKGGVK